MDLITLSINLEKEPTAYKSEYLKQIDSYTALVNLHKQPIKLIRQTLAFLMKFPNISSTFPEILLESLEKIRDTKLRKIVINHVFTLCYKQLFQLNVVFDSVINYSSDPLSLIGKCKTLVISQLKTQDQSTKVKNLLIQFYKKGNEKQKSFCYYFIVHLFLSGHNDLEEYVCEGIFEDSKVRKICHNYFLEQIEDKSVITKLSDACRSFGTRLYKEIIEKKDERENRILKMRIYVLFRNRFVLKGSIIPLALSMLDITRLDTKELMQIVVDSVHQKECVSVIEAITKHFCSPFKDDDMICYGLNLLREIYLKFARLLHEELLPLSDNEEIYKSSKNSDNFDNQEADCEDSKEEDDRNIIKYSKEDLEKNFTEKFLNDIKEIILNYINCFDKSKVKCINYAYRSVINAISRKEKSNREIDFILKKSSNEERKETKTGGMSKEERKDLFSRKSKRKFKLSKKRIRLNIQNRKK